MSGAWCLSKQIHTHWAFSMFISKTSQWFYAYRLVQTGKKVIKNTNHFHNVSAQAAGMGSHSLCVWVPVLLLPLTSLLQLSFWQCDILAMNWLMLSNTVKTAAYLTLAHGMGQGASCPAPMPWPPLPWQPPLLAYQHTTWCWRGWSHSVFLPTEV